MISLQSSLPGIKAIGWIQKIISIYSVKDLGTFTYQILQLNTNDYLDISSSSEADLRQTIKALQQENELLQQQLLQSAQSYNNMQLANEKLQLLLEAGFHAYKFAMVV